MTDTFKVVYLGGPKDGLEEITSFYPPKKKLIQFGNHDIFVIESVDKLINDSRRTQQYYQYILTQNQINPNILEYRMIGII